MTSRLSKNRPTTRPSTRRWNKLKAVVLGASVLLNLAPLAPANEPAGANRTPVLNGPSPPAAERWKRLKSQYDFAPAPVTQSPRIELPTRSTDEAAGTVTIRAIPDEQRSAFKATRTSSDTVPAEATAPTAIPVKTAAIPAVPAIPKEQEPDRVLPIPVTTDDLMPDRPTPDEIVSRPEEEPPARIVTTPQVPASTVPAPKVSSPSDPPYEGKEKGKDPAEFVPFDRGKERPITPQVPAGPPRKATQVRPIGEIAPLNDFDQDIEIKLYAAEKAREFNVRFGGEQYTPRNFPEVVVPWAAPMSKYYPLYFQDPALERYGHSHHPLVQPVASSARFASQLVLMPYQMTIDPPWELSSPLGWYRPGDVVPKLHYPFPWNAKAAAVEAVTVTGLVFLIQ